MALRNRLIDIGWLALTSTARNEGALADTLRRFQGSHRLEADGIAGEGRLEQCQPLLGPDPPFVMHQPSSDDNALGNVGSKLPRPWRMLSMTSRPRISSTRSRVRPATAVYVSSSRAASGHPPARQLPELQGFFGEQLDLEKETRMSADESIPVLFEYRTAFTGVPGGLQFRRDVRGRDGRIWAALEAEGVEAASLQG